MKKAPNQKKSSTNNMDDEYVVYADGDYTECIGKLKLKQVAASILCDDGHNVDDEIIIYKRVDITFEVGAVRVRGTDWDEI